MFNKLVFLAAIAFASGLSACYMMEPVGVAPDTSSPVAAEYRLGPGDQVRITVFAKPELSGEFSVDSAGFIAIPLLGPVESGDKTPRALEQMIAAGLTRGGYLVDPRVAVQVTQFRPYYILGEVGSSGAYPYRPGLTVRNAVAAAGGFTYRANTRRVYIQRAGDSYERLYELKPSTAVLPGDTIRIPERFF
jgi:polysaccharide export outer membrane protein